MRKSIPVVDDIVTDIIDNYIAIVLDSILSMTKQRCRRDRHIAKLLKDVKKQI